MSSVTGTVYVPVEPNNTWQINCISNATYPQRVTITLPGAPPAVFTGQGENRQMTTSSGTMCWMVQSNSCSRSATILIENFQGGRWVPSKVMQPIVTDMGMAKFYIIKSEDGSDDDWNDATVYIYSR
jgi:Fucose-binding lectin II (PA-IIL)